MALTKHHREVQVRPGQAWPLSFSVFCWIPLILRLAEEVMMFLGPRPAMNHEPASLLVPRLSESFVLRPFLCLRSTLRRPG